MTTKVLVNELGEVILDDGKAILMQEGGGGTSTKYGATLDGLLGNVDSNGVLQNPSGVTTNLVFTGVRDIGSRVLYNQFGGVWYEHAPNSTISTVSFPDLTSVSNESACCKTFMGCSNLISASFPSLISLSGSSCFSDIFEGCSSLTSVSLPLLSSITSGSALQYAFADCTSLQSLSFPALTTNSFGNTYTNQFNGMLRGVTGCTVHFPYTLETILQNWDDVKNGFSGTNTTVLYDIGAATINFNMNPNVVTYLSYKTNTKNNKPSYTNYNVQGNPTINTETGDVYDFSYDSYLTISSPYPSDTMETVVCFTTPNDSSGGDIFYGSDNQSVTNNVILDSGHIFIRIRDEFSGYNTHDFGLPQLSSNTKYWFKLITRNESTLEGYISTDGVNYTKGEYDGYTSNSSWGNCIGYGESAFGGTIHLSECYIKIGENIVWNPLVPGVNTYSTFGVGDFPYQTYFPSSNIVDYQTVDNLTEGETRNVSISVPQSYATLTVSITNDPVNSIKFTVGNIEIPVTKSGDTYTIDIANGAGKTIDYSVARTSTTAATTGTIILTGSNQTESITLDPLPTSNITLVGTPTLDTTTGILSSTDYSNYATSDYTLPTDEFEFITKVKLDYDSSQWMTGQGNAFEISGNQLCYWNVNDPYNQLFGAHVPNYGELTTGVNFDGIDIYVFFKYVQSGSMVEVYYATDWSNAWTKDTVPSNEWITIGSYDINMYGGTFPITSGTGTLTIGQNWNNPGTDMCILLNDTCIRSIDGTTTYWEPSF